VADQRDELGVEGRLAAVEVDLVDALAAVLLELLALALGWPSTCVRVPTAQKVQWLLHT
jgi:hypothetical protein